jgi:hypothetical protein
MKGKEPPLIAEARFQEFGDGKILREYDVLAIADEEGAA